MNVSVDVLPNTQMNISDTSAILVLDQSSVTNEGALTTSGDSAVAITADGGGAGQNVLINRGSLVTSGAVSGGMGNAGAAVSMLNDRVKQPD